MGPAGARSWRYSPKVSRPATTVIESLGSSDCHTCAAMYLHGGRNGGACLCPPCGARQQRKPLLAAWRNVWPRCLQSAASVPLVRGRRPTTVCHAPAGSPSPDIALHAPLLAHLMAMPTRRSAVSAAGPERCASTMWCKLICPGRSGTATPSSPLSSRDFSRWAGAWVVSAKRLQPVQCWAQGWWAAVPSGAQWGRRATEHASRDGPLCGP